MKFGLTLAETLVPEWRQHYINYDALKYKLKQAKDTPDDYLEAGQPPSTSFSIPRSVSQTHPALLQQSQQHHQEQQLSQDQQGHYTESSQQQHEQASAELLQQQDPQQQAIRRPGSSPGLRVPEALQIDGGPAEQFLQLLQQELNKVHDFITSQGSSLQAELRALAAAAPQLAQQDCQQLEQQANELGRQLLALEAYMQLNQAGFVKICKKHDKWLPDSPIWHLYLHHLQRSPWLDDNMRQYMWAALSSCYYHLHAASIHSSRGRKQLPPVPPAQQPSPRGDARAAAEQQQQGQGSAAARARAAAASSGRKVVGGLTSALGTAANAVAGAASAVAGASAAAIAAAAAAGGPATLSVPGTVQQTYAQDDQGVETARTTKKFWVRESDVPAVMYYVLQHLPLLPSKLHPTAAATGPEQGGRRASTDLSMGHNKRQPSRSSSQVQPQDTQQQQQEQQRRQRQQQQQRAATSSGSQAQQQQQQLLLQPALEGFTTSLHTVYFDNTALQLYHGRLYLRPQTQTLKARWIGQDLDRQSADSSGDLGCMSAGCCPDKVVLERKIYREGWRGEPNTKDSLLIAGDKLPQYLAGAYTLGDALADLCEVPACKAQLMWASSLVRPHQQPSRRAQLASPFAQANTAAAAAAGAAAAAADYDLTLAAQGSGSVQIPGSGVSAAAEAAAEDGQDDAAAAALAASVRLPHGLAIGSFSSKSVAQISSGGGSNPSLLQLLEREQHKSPRQVNGDAAPNGTAAAAERDSDEQQEGFEDAYLDPPVPTADQLSLFTEVQRFVGRRRLRPVLHCMLHRMVFAMPFDDRIRITLDTDVRTTALEQDLPTAAAEWHLQQHLRQLSRNSSGGMSYAPTAGSSAEISASAAVAVAGAGAAGAAGAVPAPGSSSSFIPPLPPRRPSSSSGTLPAELQASYAVWDSIFSPDAVTDRPSTGGQVGAQSGAHFSNNGGSCRDPGSPAYGRSSSSGGGGGGSGGSREPAVVYPMPYALLKVSCRLQANQSTPDWLQQLMDSEAVVPIEDWSKFIHGCAVLLPETVRAVPYWMDDGVIELSVTALQAQLEAEEARREQYRFQALQQQQQQLQRNSSAGSFSAGAGASPRSGSSPLGHPHHTNQQQQHSPILQRLSGSFRAVLTRTSSGGSSAKALQQSGSSGGGSLVGVQQMLPQHDLLQQQQQGRQDGSVMSAGEPYSNGGRRQSRLRVSTQGAGGVPRVSWADGVHHGSSSVAGTPTHSEAAAAAAEAATAAVGAEPTAESDIMWLLRKLRIVRKNKPPPLFRPEHSSSTRRPRRYNPVQLLESREYLYSESVFLHWLQLAITVASVAVLLMGYSSMAYVNPLKQPTMHIAEIICVLMLPCSCIMVGYAIRSYVWRSKRLHSMRYSRVDDQIGPLVMALVFVASMSAIMLVNIADLVLLSRARDEPSGDDPGGGDDPEGGGGEQFGRVVGVVQGAFQAMRR